MNRALKKYIGDRAFYRMVIAVALPIMLQNFITNFVSMLDNIMVGSLGTEQMSGVAIVNQILFVYNLAVFGAVGGIGIFTAQFYGKGDVEGIRHTLRFKLLTCTVLTLLSMLVIFFFGDSLIELFLHQGEYEGDLQLTFAFARRYLDIILWQLPFFALMQSIASTMRETGSAIVPMVAGIVAVVVNCTMNFVLIFGYLGFPALGVAGAAIATLLSRVVEAAILILYLMTHVSRFAYCKRIFQTFVLPRSLLVAILKKATPLLLNECCWATGISMLNVAYSLFGIEVVAATSITSTVTNLLNISFMALGISTGILVGNRLGENRFVEAEDIVRKMMAISILVGIAVGMISFSISSWIVTFFKTGEYARSLAAYFIRVSACMLPIVAVINTAYFTLRSGGRSMLTFLFDSVFVCLIQVPIAFSLYYVAHLPVMAIYPIVLACDVFKLMIGAIMLKKRIWIHNIVEKENS